MGQCIFSYSSHAVAFPFLLTTHSQKKNLDEAKKFQAGLAPTSHGENSW